MDDKTLKMTIQDNGLPNRNGRVYSVETMKKALKDFYDNYLKGKTYPVKDDKGNEYIACNPRIIFNGDSEDGRIISCSITADAKPTKYVADELSSLVFSDESLSIKSPMDILEKAKGDHPVDREELGIDTPRTSDGLQEYGYH